MWLYLQAFSRDMLRYLTYCLTSLKYERWKNEWIFYENNTLTDMFGMMITLIKRRDMISVYRNLRKICNNFKYFWKKVATYQAVFSPRLKKSNTIKMLLWKLEVGLLNVYNFQAVKVQDSVHISQYAKEIYKIIHWWATTYNLYDNPQIITNPLSHSA